MNRTAKTMLRMVPMVITMGAIFFLSHQTGDQLSLPAIPGIDKLGHMVVYGILAGTILFAFSENQKSTKPPSVMVLTVIFCILYGITDEIHQSFIPGRFVSIYDVFADGAGASVACALWIWLRTKGFFINLVGGFFAK